MPISQSDFQRACLTLKLNWPGAGNDGKTLAQRLDQLQAGVLAALDVIEQLPTEARTKELIEVAILDQHPELATRPDKPGGGGGDSLLPGEPWSDTTFWTDGFGWSEAATLLPLLLAEIGDPVLLSESGYQLLLAEA